MNSQQLNIATKATLGLGALGTLAALAYDGASAAVFTLGIWALLPYAVLLASSRFAGTGGRALVLFIVCLLASGFAIFVYADALFVHTTSTAGLVFLFIPLYQLIAAVVLLVSLFFLNKRSHPTRG